VNPILVVIVDVVSEKPAQMLLIEHDYIVDQFALT